MQNPIKRQVQKRVPYPITVKCVVKDLADTDNKATHIIRDFSISQNIVFETRVYNSYSFSEDRYMIERLPAFHVYQHGKYRRTFYLNTRPFQHIQECIDEYKDELEQKQRRRDFWKNLIPNMIKRIRKAFHRKTRMERAQEEKLKARVNEWS